MKRRDILLAMGPMSLYGSDAFAWAINDRIVIGMTLEPSPGLDPTTGAASAIAEVVLYNVFETLTKIQPDGTVVPLLAQSWEISPDLKTYTFRLRKGVRFHNGVPLTASTVKFAFDRAGSDQSINKDKRTFANLVTQVVDDHTVVVLNKEVDPDLLFLLGQATAVIVEPASAGGNATAPVGTGPYVLGQWVRGASITLNKWDGYRHAQRIPLRRVTFRFIVDPAAQIASLLAGDVNVFPRVDPRSVSQFRDNPRFQVIVSGSRGKTILAMNNKRKPLDDVRVRRAIAMAIDRNAVIQGAAQGYGAPIGSFYPPGAFGYIDTTGINAYNPDKARSLLKEAGVADLELTLTLAPMPYARQAGEVIVSQLSRAGIKLRVENVEWAQWLSGVYTNRNYDLTIISHVEPFDLGNFARPGYYWNYESAKFNALYSRYKTAVRTSDRASLLADIQSLIAQDAVHAFLYQPQWITVATRHVRGLWPNMPVFVNDVSQMSTH